MALAAGAPPITRQAEEGMPVLIRMEVDPAAEPRPALRYQLRPGVADQVPGNAAIDYQRALIQLRDTRVEEESGDKIQDWLDIPLHEMPGEEVRALLRGYETTLDATTRAARYATCDWQLPIREEGLSLVLPHLPHVRALGRLLALRARLSIAEGRFDEALADLRTGLSLARHVANGETLIEGLVGIANAMVMLERVEEWAAAPGAPNLYWALTDMASTPLARFHDALEWEKMLLYVQAPALRDLDRRTLTADQYHGLLAEVRSLATDWSGETPTAEQLDRQRLLGTGVALAVYPRACKALEIRGFSPEEVEAMPVAQAVTRYFLDRFEEARDDTLKWAAIPFPQAREGMRIAAENLDAAQKEDPLGNFLPSMLLPAVSRAYARFVDLDRRIAALRCVEALRMYASDSGGTFPDTLDNVKAVPIPEDPMTGRPFLYGLTNNTARLTLEPLPGDNPRYGRIYELTIRK
jgi:hypothetical protein